MCLYCAFLLTVYPSTISILTEIEKMARIEMTITNESAYSNTNGNCTAAAILCANIISVQPLQVLA